jgi:aspartyl-tRNA(Asn)/glutamyl-tRNA(Gln) amidotransferase subunit B
MTVAGGTGYEMVVGLEVHVHLQTKTKIFCGCSTDFGAPPNQHTCPVCLGLPGALPVLNNHAVELAIRAALALDCTVHPVSVFARKNYFYPDLPKGYQISQFDRPLATHGRVTLPGGRDDRPRTIGITRLHMEEDAGKSIHDRFTAATAVDLNRAGVPLAEIVSEPDIRTAAEAEAYLKTLKQILEYARVSDVSMEEGSLRVDANVSIRLPGAAALGTKTEIKNMNSFSAVVRAIDAETRRQAALLDSGGRVEQQTMLWDAAMEEVRPARSKEGSHDYRYFPDPDLPPLVVTGERIERIRRELPEVLTSSRALGDYFDEVATRSGDPKAAANWVLGEVLASLKASGQSIDELRVRPAGLGELLALVRDGVVSHTAAKQVFAAMAERGGEPRAIAEREGLLKVTDDDALACWIDEVFAEHPGEAGRFLRGERRLQGVLVGFVMKKSGGGADPKRVNQLLATRAGS